MAIYEQTFLKYQSSKMPFKITPTPAYYLPSYLTMATIYVLTRIHQTSKIDDSWNIYIQHSTTIKIQENEKSNTTAINVFLF
jgi:hypothetical protein